jgi:hypothetical protein
MLPAYRLLLRGTEEERAARRAAAESAPDAQKKAAGAPHPATAPLTSTTTITAQRSDLGDDHGR